MIMVMMMVMMMMMMMSLYLSFIISYHDLSIIINTNTLSVIITIIIIIIIIIINALLHCVNNHHDVLLINIYSYVEPSKRVADIIVPAGQGIQPVALDMCVSR